MMSTYITLDVRAEPFLMFKLPCNISIDGCGFSCQEIILNGLINVSISISRTK